MGYFFWYGTLNEGRFPLQPNIGNRIDQVVDHNEQAITSLWSDVGIYSTRN